MQGGAVSLARKFHASEIKPDVILASDMMNLATFRALTRHQLHAVPHALYFHENQLTYPQNTRQSHGWRYGFINYASAMSADALYFNSQFHLEAFFEALPKMLKHFYDYNELDTVDWLRERAAVLPLGLNLSRFDAHRIPKVDGKVPLLLWNHRWERDKNPSLLFEVLDKLMAEDIAFRVAVVGENVRHSAPEFEAARERLGERVVAWGYQPNFADYAHLLWQADYVISTAVQEFFGGAVAEAVYCKCVPLLPNRLNYPHLIPRHMHELCLYAPDGELATLAACHLRGELKADAAKLKQSIARHDWSQVARHYDDRLMRLAQAPPLPPAS